MSRIHSRLGVLAGMLVLGLLALGVLALPNLGGGATAGNRSAQAAAGAMDVVDPIPAEECLLPITTEPTISDVAYRQRLEPVTHCVSVRVKAEKKDGKYELKIVETKPNTIKAAQVLEIEPADVGNTKYKIRVLLPEFTKASGFTCTAAAAGAVVPDRQVGAIAASVSAPAEAGLTFTAADVSGAALETEIILYLTCTKP